MECRLFKITIPIFWKQPKIFPAQRFHIRFYSLHIRFDISNEDIDDTKRHEFQPPLKVALPVISEEDVPQATATKLDAGSSKPNKTQNNCVQGGSAEGKKKGKSKSQSHKLQAKKRRQSQLSSKVVPSVTHQVVLPVPDATNLDVGSSKPNKGQNGVQGGSAEEKKKVVGSVPGSLFSPSGSTPQGNAPQAAATKARAGSILVWYMENPKYPPMPPDTDKGLCFNTKFEDRSFDQSGDTQGFYESKLQSEYLRHIFKVKAADVVECIESLCNGQMEFVPWNESQKYVPNTLMNAAKARNGFCDAIQFLQVKCQGESKKNISDTFTSPTRKRKNIYLLTPSLAKKLVEQEGDLLKANLEVVFLSRTKAHNTKESWDCLFNSKEAVQSFKYKNDSYEAGWVMLPSKCADPGDKDLVLPRLVGWRNNNEVTVTDNEPESNMLLPHDDYGKPPEEKGNKSDEGNMGKSGNGKADIKKDANSKNNAAGNPSHDTNLKLAPTLQMQPPANIGKNKKWRLSKIMYPTMYQIGAEVNIHLCDMIGRGLVNDYVCSPYRGHQRYPGYQLWLEGDDGKAFVWWFPFFKLASDREADSLMYNVSTILCFHGKKAQKYEEEEEEDPSTPSESTDNKKNSEYVVSTDNDDISQEEAGEDEEKEKEDPSAPSESSDKEENLEYVPQDNY
eukprot:jgi/Psemu1/16845/gm1.16845_g